MKPSGFRPDVLARIREERPLVHNITNYVVMNWTANVLLAAGALPVMAHAPEEAAEMTGLARALVINIGTLSTAWIESMKLALRSAAAAKKPWILDPVGAGATRFRTQTCLELIEGHSPAVIRGNASEILALGEASSPGTTRGVESTVFAGAALEAARRLAERWNCVVCVSGPIDFILSRTGEARVENGHPLMSRVTGMGCSATALIAAALAVEDDWFEATIAGAALTGVAGEWAAEKCAGPGSFAPMFLDELHRLSPDELAQRGRIIRPAGSA
jgi:hydroxyethylthiazole kinase